MGSDQMEGYKDNGVRALVLLHEIHLKACAQTWRKAKELNVTLPVTDDKDYQSLDTLLRHILRAARGYMTWMCDNLNLPDPAIDKTPEAEHIENELDDHLTHLLQQWRLPLAEIHGEQLDKPTFTSRWGVDYCIDAMLEHAVMHPIRHEFQLKRLIEQGNQSGQ